MLGKGIEAWLLLPHEVEGGFGQWWGASLGSSLPPKPHCPGPWCPPCSLP